VRSYAAIDNRSEDRKVGSKLVLTFYFWSSGVRLADLQLNPVDD